MSPLDLSLPGAELTARLTDIPSVSGDEAALVDAIEAALRGLAHLTVERSGNALVARTELGRSCRVVLAGHVDTVPIADNLPSRREGGILHGCGTSDMKSGVAVQLRLAETLPAPSRDVTYVLYDCEEVEAARNGLGRLTRSHPDWLAADFAVLLEPTGGLVEGGCQGSMRVDVVTEGRRAHSARSWLGVNAIHAAAPILSLLESYEPQSMVVDGLEYREGLNAVRVQGGVAGNVIPDLCTVTVNFRFAPSRSEEEAFAHLRDLFKGYDLVVTDSAPAALPGLSHPAARAFVAATGGEVRPKYGWTDVSRFAALGIPAVNYGPGDPNLAHTREEHVRLELIEACEQRMRSWLTSTDAP